MMMSKKVFMKRILLVLILSVVVGCGGISMISGGSSRSDLYRQDFIKKISKIKTEYKQGHNKAALQSLKQIPEETLLPAERSLRRNLMGVIFFSENNFEQAIFNFDLALNTSRLDPALTSQIQLNLASSYFKLGFMDKSYAVLSQGDPKVLTKAEQKTFYKLKYKLSKELGKDQDELSSLILYLGDMKSLSDLKSEPLFEKLISSFFSLNKREKVRVLEDHADGQPLSVGYLAYLQAEKLYYRGEKEEATELLDWVEKKYADNNEIDSLVKGFFFRLENYAKIDPTSIGIVLPMTGPKASFGKRAMLGIDHALREKIGRTLPEGKLPFQLHVLDSAGSGAVGSYRVKELIDKHHVAVIVGGLFPQEAIKEYLEAKKYGVFFISLSQVYLPKEEKDHLLLEIPGSVESHLQEIFSNNVSERFGKRAAILYPSTPRGKAYVDEFWRRSKLSGIELGGIVSYDKKQMDFREPVKNLLGLKFTRERQEELEILTEIHSLEKNKSARRIQTLKPQVDFDWIFVPSLPRETLQLIPSFSYFDAFRLNIIGGPSWRSKAIFDESYKLGSLFFVGDHVGAEADKFSQDFVGRFGQKPRIIEMRSNDALGIAISVLESSEFQSRNELDIHIRGKERLSGVTGDWKMSDGVWIKEMAFLKLYKGKVEEIQATAEATPVNQ
ncbi:MAG: tetratricopeptide (TPR) repeat protein [Bacteriovoracaceae bacterium]|jgi:tetratricopeptide (TPR) repeat protein